MRNFKKYILGAALFLGLGAVSCTSDFSEINTDPNIVPDEYASAAFFITEPQARLFSMPRYEYWRATLIHGDRYAGHFTFGFQGCWWAEELAYSYQYSAIADYTDAIYNDWMGEVTQSLTTYEKITKPGGDFENELFYATALILRAQMFSLYTDIVGDIPYSEVGVDGINLPKYDAQKDIYSGVIGELNQAIALIGDNTKTGEGKDELKENDLYFNGDLQQWKKLAYSLRLRLAMRAHGAEGADWTTAIIQESAANPAMLLSTANDHVFVDKDYDAEEFNVSADYGDVWYGFGGLGSKWKVGEYLIDYLRDNNDPRLTLYAKPAPGGSMELVKPESGPASENFTAFTDFIISKLDEAGVEYTKTETADQISIYMPENTYYVGFPTRLHANLMAFAKYEMFSDPADEVIGSADDAPNMRAELVYNAGETHFLIAEAIARGIVSGDANTYYQNGIRLSMESWGVSSSSVDNFLATSDMGSISGLSMEEQIEKIAIQRWISDYTDGFEAWAVVRDMGYPTELAEGVSNFDFYTPGDNNGAYPQRAHYAPSEYNNNNANLQQAISRQGPDQYDVKLWWAK